MNKRIAILSILVVLGMFFSACGGQSIVNRSATFTTIENDVQARTSADAVFAPASVGQQLQVGAEVKSGEAGKARLEIQPDNTFVYVGPNTLFTLSELKTTDGNPFSRLKLAIGNLWIVLGGGSLDVETPGGVASVRGSLMGVGYFGSLTTVTCLEGHCDVTTGAGTSNLTGGQACDLTPGKPACQTRGLTGDETRGWADNVPESNGLIQPTGTFTPTFTPTYTPSPTPQPVGGTRDYGPQIGDFPPGINPLTGLPVTDPSMLDLPAILISVPLFPVSGRPQAGISFAPWVFEIYIGEGMTRLLVAFYGEQPQVKPPLRGSCQVRTEPFLATNAVLGNRAWFDENGNGIQDPNEPGIGGICVTLFDNAGNVLQTTSTDSNGYYGFNVEPGGTYRIGFEHPANLGFTTPDVGFDNTDSDAAPLTSLTPPIVFTGTNMNWDAGYVREELPSAPTPTVGPGTPTPTPESIAELPPPEVGPIRSMRLPYGTIGKFFQGGCLVSASGDPSVLAKVPGCHYAFGDDTNGAGSLLNITELRTLAEQNKNPDYPVNYSGNIFSPTPPAGGKPASLVNVFWNSGDESKFRYDPLSGAYQRFSNTPDNLEEFTPQTDRLTGQQLLYDNVIIINVEYLSYAETKLDINLGVGDTGGATLFRDGKIYPINWSTVAQAYEKQTQRLRPIRFTDASGNLIALKPGHTWVHVFTTASVVYEKNPGSGIWTAEFHAPIPGSAP